MEAVGGRYGAIPVHQAQHPCTRTLLSLLLLLGGHGIDRGGSSEQRTAVASEHLDGVGEVKVRQLVWIGASLLELNFHWGQPEWVVVIHDGSGFQGRPTGCQWPVVHVTNRL
jgi:hypothetical protein